MRIWFNHWFSTAAHLIELVRQDWDDVEMIGSHPHEWAAYQQACDRWGIEPDLQGLDYAAWCLAFAEEQQVDVFIPWQGLREIAAIQDEFLAAGIKVLVPKEVGILDVLSDKAATYGWLEGVRPELVPPYVAADTFEVFGKAIQDMGQVYPGGRACYKLAVDEGASSFRVVDDRVENVAALRQMPGAKVTRQAAERILSGYDFKVPVLVMPYLDGPEISADCLVTEDGPIILPRYKLGRRSEVCFDPGVIADCQALLKALAIDVPVNLQFRCHHGQRYLLEINARMSGGLQQSCLATGVNIPRSAVRQLLGERLSWKQPEAARYPIAQLEAPCPVIRAKLAPPCRIYTEADLLRVARRWHNDKRSYLLVDPLQGKHIPVEPQLCCHLSHTLGRKVAEALAGRGERAAAVIAFAETATAVGGMVARELAKDLEDGSDVLYLPTTREEHAMAAGGHWLEFREEHSHAVGQLVAVDALRKVLQSSEGAVVFVDDEFSTGRTLQNILHELRRKVPEALGRPVIAASLLTHLDEAGRLRLAADGVECVSIVQVPDRDYTAIAEASVIKAPAPWTGEDDSGRLGLPLDQKLISPRQGVMIDGYRQACERAMRPGLGQLVHEMALYSRVLVVGTEECMLPGLDLGSQLAGMRPDLTVRFQATTRSPIGVAQASRYPIWAGWEIPSFYEADRRTYIYDLECYDAAVIVSDSDMPCRAKAEHVLIDLLKSRGVQKVFLC